MHYLDIENWNRKEIFNHFIGFDEPYHSVVVEIDCTLAYQQAKQLDTSFFIYYVHACLSALNTIPAFKYRLEAGNKIAIHDSIGVSATVNRPDNTFGFSYIPFDTDFFIFEKLAKSEIERIRMTTSLFPEVYSEACIHLSALPWINFTSLTHARHLDGKDSVPKISFGKMSAHGQRRTMPMSVHVHHALVDGYDVGLFVERFQVALNTKGLDLFT